ncbi:unnamed protein product [Tilletia controversa]|uniref:Uncharacterized protein n=1 Tax=Tilletia caries TaxID=13290 RepID=A0A177TR32_9BASI|nr:hypothetical protein CF335_g1948 [Tilletia laevis]KAE8241878.1 hypothetical protein A4X03_0g8069 [Tilletia caries]CAD6900255.1 unnamed protein product [Tilletia controversa]CAD6909528.1 unnamed protein product [Tilletia controversa]CAD6938435.1 unnamed protein product [Tilletia caries]
MHDTACPWELLLTPPSSGPSAPSVSLVPPASFMSTTRSAVSTLASGSSALSFGPSSRSGPAPRVVLRPSLRSRPRPAAQTHRLHAQRTRHAVQRSPPSPFPRVSSHHHGGAHEPPPGMVGSRTSMVHQNDYPIQNDLYTRLRTPGPGLFPGHGRNRDPFIARMGTSVLSPLLNQIMHIGSGAGLAILRPGTLSTQFYEVNASNVLNANAINAPGNHVVIDVITKGLYLDPGFLGQFFQEHLDSWITEDDLRQIAAVGLNHLRIPIGHWAFPDCIESGVAYQAQVRVDLLKLGVRWAQKYNIKVWIDLPGTPGSRNGYSSSGRAGVAHWPNNATYVDMTEKAFNYLVAEFTQYTYKGTVTAIQPVNEPVGAYSKPVQNLVNTYYLWNFNNAQQSEPVITDAHPYFVYAPQEVDASDTFRLCEVCQYGTKISQSQRYYPTVAAEWSIGAPNRDNFPVLRDLPASD